MGNIVHLFWECEVVWLDIQEELADIPLVLNLRTVFLGSEEDINGTLILHGKRYIYECRLRDNNPTLNKFMIKIDYVRKLEFQIAKYSNKLHLWEILYIYFGSVRLSG